MRPSFKQSFVYLSLLILMVGCQSPIKFASKATPTHTATPTNQRTPTISDSDKIITPTLQPTKSPTATITPQQTIINETVETTDIELSNCASVETTPLFDQLPYTNKIAANNISEINLLAQKGLGVLDQIAISTDNKIIAAATPYGVHFFDATSLSSICRLDTELPVYSVAFSPDEDLLAYSEGSNIVLWNMERGFSPFSLQGHKNNVDSLAFSPEGDMLASGSADGTVRLWQITETETTQPGKQIKLFYGHTAGLAFSPDGEMIVSGVERTAKFFRVSDGILLYTMQRIPYGEVTSLQFSPDGNFLALGAGHNRVELWQVENYGPMLYSVGWEWNYPNTTTSVAFSPDGKTIASTSGDGTLRLWKTTDGTLIRTIEEHAGAVTSVVFTNNGKEIITSSRGYPLQRWQTADGSLLKSTDTAAAEVFDLAFSPDNQYLAVAANTHILRIYQLDDFSLWKTLYEPTKPIKNVDFSSEGSTIATIAWDNNPDGDYINTARLWKLPDGAQEHVLEWGNQYFGPTESVAIFMNGYTIAAGSGSGAETGTGNWISWIGYIRQLSLVEQNEQQTMNLIWLAQPPDGISPEKAIELDVANMAPNYIGPVTSLAFSSDGLYLASASYAGYANIWNMTEKLAKHTLWGWLGTGKDLQFSPDNQKLAVITARGVRIWDVASGQLHQTYTGHTEELTKSAYSHDGHLFACGSINGNIHIWQTSDAQLLTTLQQNGSVTSLMFSPDDTLLASGSSYGITNLWGIEKDN